MPNKGKWKVLDVERYDYLEFSENPIPSNPETLVTFWIPEEGMEESFCFPIAEYQTWQGRIGQTLTVEYQWKYPRKDAPYIEILKIEDAIPSSRYFRL